MRTRCFFVLIGLAALLFSTVASAAPQVYEIKAGASRRVITVGDDLRLQSSAVFAAGEEAKPVGPEFTVIIGGKKIKSTEASFSSINDSVPGKLSVLLSFVDPSYKFTATVEMAAREPGFIVKTVTIKTETPLFLNELILESLARDSSAQTFDGPGQPIYLGNSFIAAAYPSAKNSLVNGHLECSYLVGQTVTDSYTSYSSIYGVAPAGEDVREFFQAAVESMRARPVRPFLLWNSWYHVFDFADTQIIDAIGDFKKKLIDPYGIRIDSFVMDDGWDDYRHVWAPHPKRFPNGFGTVTRAAEAAGGHPGLWMSPVGGYGFGHQKRVFFATGKGYESNKFGFCIAGKNYGQAFGDYLTGYQRDYGVNYFKFDNIDSSCKSTRHGHRAGEYAQVALTDAFIGVMKRARETNPDVAINITVGSWMSPFWTIWCDFVWRTGNDWGLFGVGSQRQQSITYVDTILYQKLRVEDLQFPVNSLMTHGIIKGLRQNFAESAPPRDFFDDIWMYFGRGVMMQELYLSPELLSDTEWKELARAIKWSAEHAALVSKARMILGDPRKLEVYGFKGRMGKETVLTLRNPNLVERPAPAEELAACKSWQVIYASTGAAPADKLGAMETRVLYCAGE